MLTEAAVRSAKPSPGRAVRLFDGRGLYLEVAPAGGKWWRLKYRFGGKEKRLSLGVYPEVSLATARRRRDELRLALADGRDPGAERKARTDAAPTLNETARAWLAKQAPTWAAGHAARVRSLLERDVLPFLGDCPVDAVTPPQVLDVLRRIEARGAVETAHRARYYLGQLFRYAIAEGRALRDPAEGLQGALAPVVGEHFAAITEPRAVGALLRAIDEYQGTLVVRCALRLAPLVFVRPGELRRAEWQHIDLDAAEWRFVTSKTGTPHVVPLATQTVSVLRELQPLTGAGRYVFPSERGRGRPMSENTVLVALRALGFGAETMTGHGFRAMARTLLDEALKFPAHLIEHQLGHIVRDPLGRAYNRTTHLEDRRRMMQRWADYLDELRATEGNVIPLRSRAG